ncbi:MAG: MBL fold metallo-hydrolase [Promethearchaeota archaeon]
MSEKKKVEAIRRLYAIPLEVGEVAFVYAGYSSIVCRLPNTTFGIDLGGYFKEVNALESLDLLCLTHHHRDHFDPKTTVAILKATSADIVVEPDLAQQLEGKIPSEKLFSAHPGDSFKAGQYEIRGVVGVHFGPITLFHIKYDDLSIFHAGDSGYIPLKDYPATLAFLPCGSPSPSCSPNQALQMAQDIQPRIAVAVHGNQKERVLFSKLVGKDLPDTRVVIPEPYNPIKLAL